MSEPKKKKNAMDLSEIRKGLRSKNPSFWRETETMQGMNGTSFASGRQVKD